MSHDADLARAGPQSLVNLCVRFFELSPDPLCVVDASHRIIHANPALSRLVGPDAVGVRPCWGLLLSPDRERAQAAFEAMAEGEPSATFTARLRDAAGEVRTIAWTLHGLGFNDMVIGLGRDITEQVAAEEAARQERYKLAQIVGQSEDAIYIKDVERRYMLINPAGLRLMRRTEPEVIAHRDEDIFPAETAHWIREHDEAVMRTRTPSRYDSSVVVPGGERHYETFKYPYFLPDGRLGGVVAIVHDFTQRDALHATIRVQNERLARADRLKTTVLRMVSHDIRTPLTTIKGYLEFLDDELGGPLTPEQGEFLGQIRAAAGQIEGLVTELIDFVLLEGGTFPLRCRKFELVGLVREVVRSFEPRLQASRVRVAVEAPERLALQADDRRLEQVLQNLVGNAIKFSPEGGTVTVRVRPEADAVRLEVSDQGPGVSAEQHSRLFLPFSQLELGRRECGIGLGLSIARAIVEAHHGTIGVTSPPDQGATFWLRLPLSCG